MPSRDRSEPGSLAGLLWTMGGLALTLWVAVLLDPVADPWASWQQVAVLAIGFVVTELTELNVEVRRQALSLSLSEIPFVLGLFLVPAHELLAVRLAGTLVVALWRHKSPAKITFNLLVVAIEVAVVVVVFHALAGRPPVDDAGGPGAWAAAYCAMIVGTLVSGLLVASAIVRLQGVLPSQELFFLCVPLVVSAALNTTVAVMILLVVETDARALVLLAVLLVGVAVAYRGYGELLRRHRSLGQLHDLIESWTRARGSREIAEQLLLHSRTLLRAGHAELLLSGIHGSAHLVLGEGEDRPADRAQVGSLLRDVHTLDRASFAARGHRGRATLLLDTAHLRDAAAVPLRQDGRSFGALLVANRLGETSTFGRRDVAMLEMIGAQAAVALDNSRLVERLTYEARHDNLTALPNRSAFLARTDVALRAGGGLSVLLMDLDGFKEVNDTLGHSHGDELLKAVAERLVVSVAGDVFVARLGGDEFALLVPDLPDRDGLTVAAALRASLLAPFLIDGLHLDVRASVGVSRHPEDGDDSSTLLKRADIAMYEAKAEGDVVRPYNAAADRSSHRRLALVGQLRSAVDGGELVCFYQPKVDLMTGRVVGAEALVRWPHPELGLVAPDDFIPIAEQTGLIGPLTWLVLCRALTQAATWTDAFGWPGIAVNVSPRGLLGAGFVASVLQALDETGVDPNRLMLEITESSVMADPERAIEVLTQLHEAGVRLSVDDFGTGYSSLAYLQRLPVDEVKIDRSFVLGLGPRGERSEIVQAIIELGHTLGMQVLAEGVEDERTAALLLGLGCDLAQGYLYSPAIDGEAFRTWLRQRPPARVVPAPRLLPLARRA